VSRKLYTLSYNVTRNILEIHGRRRIFRLREPIDLEEEDDSGRFTVEYAPLNIHGYGATKDAALDMLAEAFEDLYEYSHEGPESGMTADAVELKRKVDGLVIWVRDAGEELPPA
jgi:hypothetical protein